MQDSGDSMTLGELQREVDERIREWDEDYWSTLSIFARLTEETGELSRELNQRYGDKPRKDDSKNKVEDEVADVLFTLICLSNSLGIDMDRAFRKKIEKYESRRESDE